MNISIRGVDYSKINSKTLKATQALVRAAIAYEKITSRDPRIIGEIGEIRVCERLKLCLVRNQQNAGYDAVHPKSGKTYQIKARRRADGKKGKVGHFSSKPFNWAILVVLSKQYKIDKCYEISRRKLEPLLHRSSKRSPSFAAFVKIASDCKSPL